MIKAVYPGSFDPVTNGHLDIINRASKILDYVTVAILENPRKQPMFTVNERLEMLKRITCEFDNVGVEYYHGLLVDYVSARQTSIIIKGLRAISDFEFEFQMALINRKLNPKIETLFMMTNDRCSFLSSSIIKEVAGLGGDISGMVPPQVYDMIMAKMV
ncbi:MAG: pantetheine-phosphate adenylyltransferase [Firmicutes bacterium]|nr:pantetheine-phosphate adenylyltransferase [Bacillota bacterium]